MRPVFPSVSWCSRLFRWSKPKRNRRGAREYVRVEFKGRFFKKRGLQELTGRVDREAAASAFWPRLGHRASLHGLVRRIKRLTLRDVVRQRLSGTGRSACQRTPTLPREPLPFRSDSRSSPCSWKKRRTLLDGTGVARTLLVETSRFGSSLIPRRKACMPFGGSLVSERETRGIWIPGLRLTRVNSSLFTVSPFSGQ